MHSGNPANFKGSTPLIFLLVKMGPLLTYSNSIKIAIRDKPSGGDSVLHVARPSHHFGGDCVTNEEFVSGVILGLIMQ
jgi:hypothetical protein